MTFDCPITSSVQARTGDAEGLQQYQHLVYANPDDLDDLEQLRIAGLCVRECVMACVRAACGARGR